MTPQGMGTVGAAAVQSLAEESNPELNYSIGSASNYLLARQAAKGYWVGELEADTSLESDYILLQLWLYPPGDDGVWSPPSTRRVQSAARYILSRQLVDGGWNIYPGGPANVSASVKAYLALRLAGYETSDIRLENARGRVIELGGVEGSNSYTKIYLSFFGLYDRTKTPTIPPELFLLPNATRLTVYDMSSWTRAILAPLAILGARGATRPVPSGIEIRELFSGVEHSNADSLGANLFLIADKALKIWQRAGMARAREKAVRATADWMVKRLHDSDGLGAIFPAMMNCIMALTELGYTLDDPLLKREIEKFDQLIIEERDTLRLQPCFSPVWDTALAVHALGAGNQGSSESVLGAIRQAGDWLLTKEVRKHGDWSVKNREGVPGGWYFEFANEFYPDTDDTAQVLLALDRVQTTNLDTQRAAQKRGVEWLLSMQSKDGGWGAFDVDNNLAILNHVPFADHNAMLDTTCPDLTGRVLDALCTTGPGPAHPAVKHGVEFLKRAQEDDGSWFGRWGVNYIYGTCFALRGLAAANEDSREAYIIRAGEWLRSIQNADGGWGESCESYDNPSAKGLGESTPSQTAWALLGLFASADYRSGSVESGIRYLWESQKADGSWDENYYTGTGFPSVFYLKYDLYRQYFPLLALTEYRNWLLGAS